MNEVKFDLVNRKVLFVVNDPAFLISHRINTVLKLKEIGCDVLCAVPEGKGIETLKALGLNYKLIPLHRWRSNPLLELKSILSLFSVYRAFKPDIVHHVTIKPVLYGSLVARLLNVSLIVNAISGRGRVFIAGGFLGHLRRVLVENFYRMVLNSSKVKVIFQNPEDQEYFVSRGLINKNSAVLIPGAGVDENKFAPDFDDKNESQDNPVRVLLGARLLWEKGIEVFVEASKILKDSGIPCEMVVVGEEVPDNPGGIPSHVIKKWNDSSPCKFLGFRSEMQDELRQAEIICLPTFYGEGIPKFLIEAAASGKAIVTTDWPGCREVVIDGYNGILVPPKDPIALATAIKELCTNAPLRKKMGKNSRAHFLEGGFSESSVVNATLSLYTKVKS